jgi:acetyl-CoA hydrolase
MYSEVVQNAVVDLIMADRIRVASASALVVTSDYSKRIYDDLKFFKERLVLRPQEIANHPEIIRRLGIVSINTALEVDLFGHVNSTHLWGSGIVNGIGGSGDFTRNGYISIFTLPSVAKGGKISSLVPMCSHVDHTEHDVQGVATEWGMADLRGKDPSERAREIIEKCAHPDYRPILRHALEQQKKGHIRQNLSEAFRLHRAYLEKGDMRLI